MLHPGRLPMAAAEERALERLLAKHPTKPISLTRRDPGENGPLLVHAGDRTYVIDAAGRTRRQR